MITEHRNYTVPN